MQLVTVYSETVNRFLAEIDAFTTGLDQGVYVVRVHRYDNPEHLFGWHIIVPTDYPDSSSWPFRQRTLGLIDPLDDASLVCQLMLDRKMHLVWYPALIHLPVVDEGYGYPNLQSWITHQIAPVEWQRRMADHDQSLLSRISVLATPDAAIN